MFINLSISELFLLKELNLATPVSRWENIEKANAFYSKLDGNFAACEEEINKLRTAYSTPVRVYLIKKCW